ncbi:helix-turn-helix domain-containing protein [Streptomyces cinnamoneus]|uniref:Transcriptional regulator n=1 Tax=Streptomyces cinnamoneus TaxID=53446 RepID=A0A918WPE7_STRCJ|nr:helix-turn-helix transcriptional regulator [Streptomyces cinnamoneus]GHC61855.1 transcriptional regulator [Streptomyces cinnamoneus]
MGEAESQPPIGWRYCGDQLKLWRQRAGVSREELGKEAGYGYETIKSMEQGRRRPSLRVLQVADQMCGAAGLLEAAHPFLRPEEPRSVVQDFFRYEAEAIVYSSCEPMFIPGLLQTEETMRALFNSAWPPVDDATVEERVAVRLGRQTLLDKQTVAFSFVIGELPLRYPVVSNEAHRRQLLRILEVGQQRNVTAQVMPLDRYREGLDRAIMVLELPGHDRIAYEEAHATGGLYGDPAKVSSYAQKHALNGRVALNPAESVRFIRELSEEL